VLHSHAHFDHIGDSAKFERVYVHATEADDLREGYPGELFRPWFEPEHLVGDRLPEDFDVASASIAGCEPAGTIEHGQRFDLGGRTLEAFHTPGHSPGGITLLDRDARVLFPGDAVYAGPMFAWKPYSDAVAYRETLRLLAELAELVDVIYPSHNRVPLTSPEVRAMHNAYEQIWAGRTPDRSDDQKDIFEFGDFSFWLPVGLRLG
jgi:glyoxylase-like metal-dependent hydrolase (beta-lactamase superfamily II)